MFQVPFLLKNKAPTCLLFHFLSQISDCIFLNTTVIHPGEGLKDRFLLTFSARCCEDFWLQGPIMMEDESFLMVQLLE